MGHGTDPPSSETSADRAWSAWRALVEASVVATPRSGRAVLDPPCRRRDLAAVWPLGQVLVAAADLELIGGAAPEEAGPLADLLERYRGGDRASGYGPRPGDRTRYYDDNAWLGLWFVQRFRQNGDTANLDAAQDVATFVARGQGADGGVRWMDTAASPRNTCATAPFATLAAHLAELTGRDPWRARAEAALGFLAEAMEGPDGLYADHVDPDGSVDGTRWSYNQGTPIGALVRWYHLTGDRSRVEAAVRTASAALAHFGADDRWWRQPPAFNAIFFRNLMQLHLVVPQPEALAVLRAYLDRVWQTARDPVTGLLHGGGIGRYETSIIDQAGLVQLFALMAVGAPAWSVVT